ncbi:hypothetical protein PTTG_07497 [Puccinia triticina 1-1 BBBD Race 1]|uniref:Uncharacterized protein n=1 Tax=Puccinia triticina (isolate 1-1 / race 1 (BBBD)) TaxID=630390 RepID=A0A180GZQ2_PUCT1|nr:hypothetical protein PTTG_07497 [Puccinia triticina 1-1 BBBD Race 1]
MHTYQLFFTVFHPLFKEKYFKLAKLEPNWIAEAIRLAGEMWISFYKPQPPSIPLTSPTLSSKASHLPKTSMLAVLEKAAQGGNELTNTFDIWLSRGLILDGSKPVNPLKWRRKQNCACKMHGGLVAMALDVLSCPGKSNGENSAFS